MVFKELYIFHPLIHSDIACLSTNKCFIDVVRSVHKVCLFSLCLNEGSKGYSMAIPQGPREGVIGM